MEHDDTIQALMDGTTGLCTIWNGKEYTMRHPVDVREMMLAGIDVFGPEPDKTRPKHPRDMNETNRLAEKMKAQKEALLQEASAESGQRTKKIDNRKDPDEVK